MGSDWQVKEEWNSEDPADDHEDPEGEDIKSKAEDEGDESSDPSLRPSAIENGPNTAQPALTSYHEWYGKTRYSLHSLDQCQPPYLTGAYRRSLGYDRL